MIRRHDTTPQNIAFSKLQQVTLARATGGQFSDLSRGRDKKAYIAALRQAKFYPTRQAAAAADRALQQLPSNLWLPQSTSRNPRGRMIHLLDCSSSWIVAVGVEAPQCKPFYTVRNKSKSLALLRLVLFDLGNFRI